SPPLAWRHLATKRQKVWPQLATTGDNWRPSRHHLAWRLLATVKNGAWRQLATTRRT
ncbi:hypothetical protein A2U01_0059262, partial [Trifolium medium]|nr:hypothetical protein [Trifolium medium]